MMIPEISSSTFAYYGTSLLMALAQVYGAPGQSRSS